MSEHARGHGRATPLSSIEPPFLVGSTYATASLFVGVARAAQASRARTAKEKDSMVGVPGTDVKGVRYAMKSLYRPARGMLTVRTEKLRRRNHRGGA